MFASAGVKTIRRLWSRGRYERMRSAPAAVANAVADALAPLGVEITELPVTPERLFRLIKARTQKD